MTQSARIAANLALAIIALVVTIAAAHRATRFGAAGMDFWPQRNAANALLHGRSIYASPLFVYPPTAAIAFIPFTLGSRATALHAWLYLEIIALIAGCFIATRPQPARWRTLGALLAVAVLMKSDLTYDNLWLANPTLLLAPFAVTILLCFDRDHWRTGCALLALTLLFKPLLLPLLLIPVLHSRWRDLAVTLIPAIVALAIAIIVVPGASRLGYELHHALNGSDLTGQLSVYNLSLNGLGHRLHDTSLFVALRIVLAIIALTCLAAWWQQRSKPGANAALGTLALASTFLIGNLAEGHYVIVLALCLLVTITQRPTTEALILAAAAFLLLFIPRFYLGNADGSAAALQVRYLLVELLIFAAVAVPLLHSSVSRHLRLQPA